MIKDLNYGRWRCSLHLVVTNYNVERHTSSGGGLQRSKDALDHLKVLKKRERADKGSFCTTNMQNYKIPDMQEQLSAKVCEQAPHRNEGHSTLRSWSPSALSLPI